MGLLTPCPWGGAMDEWPYMGLLTPWPWGGVQRLGGFTSVYVKSPFTTVKTKQTKWQIEYIQISVMVYFITTRYTPHGGMMIKISDPFNTI